MNRKRGLSIAMIRRLHERRCVDPTESEKSGLSELI
jgi:hypothetical protein